MSDSENVWWFHLAYISIFVVIYLVFKFFDWLGIWLDSYLDKHKKNENPE